MAPAFYAGAIVLNQSAILRLVKRGKDNVSANEDL